MAAIVKPCATCGNDFSGRTGAAYCSAACKQRAHRARRRGSSNAAPVTAAFGGGGHGVEALNVLRALDAELAVNAAQLGEPLEWSAAECAVLELVGDTIDRRVDLKQRYGAVDDDKLRLKLAAELRLIESALARLLKQVKTELPTPKSLTSVKATRAANTRWARDATR